MLKSILFSDKKYFDSKTVFIAENTRQCKNGKFIEFKLICLVKNLSTNNLIQFWMIYLSKECRSNLSMSLLKCIFEMLNILKSYTFHVIKEQ